MKINDYDYYVQSLNKRQLHKEKLLEEKVHSKRRYQAFEQSQLSDCIFVHKIAVPTSRSPQFS